MELRRVLRRDDKERTVERARVALDGDLALAQRFEQRRLGARGGAVHLVGEHDVGEDWAGDELEGQVFLVEDARAGDVGGQEVRSALDPAKGAADRRRQGSSKHRLAGSGQVLEQYVPPGDETRQGEPDDLVLADDDVVDVLLDPIEKLGGSPRFEGTLLGGRHGPQSSQALSVLSLPNHARDDLAEVRPALAKRN